MALTKRSVPIPIGGGVDEHESELAFEAPLLRQLVNAQIPKQGSYTKRSGEAVLQTAGLPAVATYGQHNAVADQDGRAVLLTQLGAYMHDPAKNAWSSAGAISPRPSRCLVDALVRSNNSISEPEIVLVELNERTVACIAWHDTDLMDGFYMFAEVPDDGAPMRILSGPTKFGSSNKMAFGVRLTTIGTTVFAVAGDANPSSSTYACKVNVSSSYTFGTPSTYAWSASSSPVALLSDNSASLWLVLDEGSSVYSIRKIDTSFVETASQTGIAGEALDAVRVGTTIVVIRNDGSIAHVSDALGSLPTPVAVVATGASGPLYTSCRRATLCEAASGGFFCAWERAGSGAGDTDLNHGVVIALVSSSYTVTSSGVVGTVCLAGRAAYRSAEAVPLLPVLDNVDTRVWRSGHICKPATDTAGAYGLAEVARFGQDVAQYQARKTDATEETSGAGALGGPTATRRVDSSSSTVAIPQLPSLVYDAASSQWLMPHLVVTDVATGAVTAPILGADLLRLAMQDVTERNVSAASLRIFAGGAGATYVDGPVHAEMTPPPIGVLIADNVDDLAGSDFIYIGSAGIDDLFLAVAVRWRDEKGRLHRGVPVKGFGPVQYKEFSAPLNQEATRIRFPRPFPATIRGEKGGQRYELEVYAADNIDGPYYYQDLVTPQPHPTHLGVDFFVVNFDDGNTFVTSGIPLGCDYVANVLSTATRADFSPRRWFDENAELVHVPPPAALDIASTQSRIWLLSSENGRRHLFPSKLIVEGYAPEFPTALRIVLPDEGGEATAIAALGDQIIVFKERQVYAIFGDPGDNAGANSTIQTPRLIPSDVGCAEAASVVETPMGIVFRGAGGGFHLLASASAAPTRLPQLEDTLDDFVVTSGAIVADRKEVRWTAVNDDGDRRTLVWDYEANAWLTHEFASGAVCGGVVDGVYHRVAETGFVHYDRETWSVTEDIHRIAIESAWIKPDGIQGFVRVWKTLYQFAWRNCGIRISIGYDYADGYTDERTWTAAELEALSDNGIFELEVQHSRQKIKAFRFLIEDVSPGGQEPGGQAFTLYGARMQVGIRPGTSGKLLAAANRK